MANVVDRATKAGDSRGTHAAVKTARRRLSWPQARLRHHPLPQSLLFQLRRPSQNSRKNPPLLTSGLTADLLRPQAPLARKQPRRQNIQTHYNFWRAARQLRRAPVGPRTPQGRQAQHWNQRWWRLQLWRCFRRSLKNLWQLGAPQRMQGRGKLRLPRRGPRWNCHCHFQRVLKHRWLSELLGRLERHQRSS